MACESPVIVVSPATGAEYEITLLRIKTRQGWRWTWANVANAEPHVSRRLLREAAMDILRNPEWGYLTRREAFENAREFYAVPNDDL